MAKRVKQTDVAAQLRLRTKEIVARTNAARAEIQRVINQDKPNPKYDDLPVMIEAGPSRVRTGSYLVHNAGVRERQGRLREKLRGSRVDEHDE